MQLRRMAVSVLLLGVATAGSLTLQQPADAAAGSTVVRTAVDGTTVHPDTSETLIGFYDDYGECQFTGLQLTAPGQRWRHYACDNAAFVWWLYVW
jgi:hypothetical protein